MDKEISVEIASNEVEKPPFLYHASPNNDIKEFQPQAGSVRDPKEGPVIFGARDLALASTFLVEADDSWTERGTFGGAYYFVVSDRDRFKSVDKGGALYVLPNSTFECDLNKGMGDLEWISEQAVKPVDKTVYESALDAMINNGVQVYFIDQGTFLKIQQAEDHGLSILQSLESENQKRGTNIFPLTK